MDPIPPTDKPPSPAPTALPELVAFKNVTKTFGEGAAAKVAIQDVTFTVEDLPHKGELVTVVGPSGCGKSTLIRIIAGLKPHFPPTSGEARVFGKPVQAAGPDRGLVDQKYSLLPHLTVLDNVAFGLREHTRLREGQIRERVREKLELVGLRDVEHLWPAELSGGMKKRVALARALAMEPQILLYDEPTTGLDPIRADAINELIIGLRTRLRVTGVAITHDMTSAYKIADRIAMLYKGRIVAVGTPAEIRESADPVVRQFVSGSARGPITDDELGGSQHR